MNNKPEHEKGSVLNRQATEQRIVYRMKHIKKQHFLVLLSNKLTSLIVFNYRNTIFIKKIRVIFVMQTIKIRQHK